MPSLIKKCKTFRWQPDSKSFPELPTITIWARLGEWIKASCNRRFRNRDIDITGFPPHPPGNFLVSGLSIHQRSTRLIVWDIPRPKNGDKGSNGLTLWIEHNHFL